MSWASVKIKTAVCGRGFYIFVAYDRQAPTVVWAGVMWETKSRSDLIWWGCLDVSWVDYRLDLSWYSLHFDAVRQTARSVQSEVQGAWMPVRRNLTHMKEMKYRTGLYLILRPSMSLVTSLCIKPMPSSQHVFTLSKYKKLNRRRSRIV